MYFLYDLFRYNRQHWWKFLPYLDWLSWRGTICQRKQPPVDLVDPRRSGKDNQFPRPRSSPPSLPSWGAFRTYNRDKFHLPSNAKRSAYESSHINIALLFYRSNSVSRSRVCSKYYWINFLRNFQFIVFPSSTFHDM